MKKLFVLSAVIALTSLCCCQKQQTEAEKSAEIERQVQERLAAERQTQQQQQLDQRQADLDAREKALAEKENSAAVAPTQSEQAESESRPRAPRERAVTTGYTTFYNKLEPYGDWIETGDYGYVFHPHEAASSLRWRPYTDGRWVYTDAGWTWISEEPFGWATYHYGRWTRLRGVGWVWVPGNQWAPAWVSWRKSNDYVGWAPLPPEARFDQRTGIRNWSDSYYDVGPDQYCFVASREFGAPRIGQTLLPPERNVAIVNQTTNVTNITYNNRTIVNEGPSYDELRAISREPVQRFRLEQNANVDVSGQPPRPEFRGETIVIAAPVIASPVASERPPTVRQTITAAAFDLGWAAISNQDEAKKTRQKMKSEATPPPNAPPKKFARATAQANGNPPASEGGTTSAASTPSPSAIASPVQTATPASTPKSVMTPRSMVTAAPISSASASPTASQRRGRLLVPPGSPTPSASAVATTTAAPTKRPTAIEEPTLIPAPSAPPGNESQKPPARGQFKSQAQKFNPRKVQPMPSASASAPATSAASPVTTSTPASSPGEKVTKQEQKEQKREERKELKRERKEGLPNASPSPSSAP